jgi:hypothetical protein
MKGTMGRIEHWKLARANTEGEGLLGRTVSVVRGSWVLPYCGPEEGKIGLCSCPVISGTI